MTQQQQQQRHAWNWRRASIWFSLLLVIILVLVASPPPVARQTGGNRFTQVDASFRLRKKEIRALKKLAIAATVLGHHKKLMIPLPFPLPLPIPIVHKHEPIIAPYDLKGHIIATKAQILTKGAIGGGFGGLGGLGGGGIY